MCPIGIRHETVHVTALTCIGFQHSITSQQTLKPVTHFRIFFFFFQNNTYFQTNSLVSIVSKLFRKLTSRVIETRDYYSKSSIKDSIFMKIHVELKYLRLEFHKRKPRVSLLFFQSLPLLPLEKNPQDSTFYKQSLKQKKYKRKQTSRIKKPKNLERNINKKNQEIHPKTQREINKPQQNINKPKDPEKKMKGLEENLCLEPSPPPPGAFFAQVQSPLPPLGAFVNTAWV